MNRDFARLRNEVSEVHSRIGMPLAHARGSVPNGARERAAFAEYASVLVEGCTKERETTSGHFKKNVL